MANDFGLRPFGSGPQHEILFPQQFESQLAGKAHLVSLNDAGRNGERLALRGLRGTGGHFGLGPDDITQQFHLVSGQYLVHAGCFPLQPEIDNDPGERQPGKQGAYRPKLVAKLASVGNGCGRATGDEHRGDNVGRQEPDYPHTQKDENRPPQKLQGAVHGRQKSRRGIA